MSVTAQGLGLRPGERDALRDAGILPSDVLHLRAVDLVGATGDLITRRRASEIAARASLLVAGIGSGFAGTLMALGVRDRDDLAARDPDELFVHVLAASRNYADSALYDRIAQAVYLANTPSPPPHELSVHTWSRRRRASGHDPVLGYWRHVHGSRAALPVRTTQRLHIPDARITARIWIADQPVWPVDGGAVRCGQVVISHHLWRGAQAPFHELESVKPGYDVTLAGERYVVVSVMRAAPPDAPAVPPPSADELLLTTPPNNRPRGEGLVRVEVRCAAI